MSDQVETAPTLDVTSDDKLWAALSYVFSPVIPIIMLLIEDKKSRSFIKFHAVQSLVIGVVLFIVVPIIATFTMVYYALLGV